MRQRLIDLLVRLEGQGADAEYGADFFHFLGAVIFYEETGRPVPGREAIEAAIVQGERYAARVVA